MIKVVTEAYCENCPYFKDKLIHYTYYINNDDTERRENIEIHCKHENRCKRLSNYILHGTMIRVLNPENPGEIVSMSLMEMINTFGLKWDNIIQKKGENENDNNAT